MSRPAVTPRDEQVGVEFLAGWLRDGLNVAHKYLVRIQRFDFGTAFQLCGLTFELTGPLRYVAKGPE